MTKKSFLGNQPKLIPIDTGAYLGRIGMTKEAPSARYLKELHLAHLLHVPFENLDIHYGKRIVLDYQKIFGKVVNNRRGGFCYELNGLFYHLLVSLGFDATIASAKPKREGRPTPDFDHMAIIVKMDDDLILCDVGYGNLMRFPKKIAVKEPQLDYTAYFRFDINPDNEWILQKSQDNSHYKSVYQFDLKPKQLIEFLARCNFHQDSIDSFFKKQKLITRLFENGRITLTGKELKTHLSGETNSQPILSEDEFLFHLKRLFGIAADQLFQ